LAVRAQMASIFSWVDQPDRDVEFLGEESTEAGAVEHAGHADDFVRRQAGFLLQQPHHDIERVGDDDDEGVGAVGLDAFSDGDDDAGVFCHQIVTRHARHAWEAGGDDDDVRARDGGVIRAACHMRIEAFDRPGLGDVERFALGDAGRDIEQDDVAEFLESDQMGEGPADVARADERDFIASHQFFLSSRPSLRAMHP
jgi:hypothetical protein